MRGKRSNRKPSWRRARKKACRIKWSEAVREGRKRLVREVEFSRAARRSRSILIAVGIPAAAMLGLFATVAVMSVGGAQDPERVEEVYFDEYGGLVEKRFVRVSGASSGLPYLRGCVMEDAEVGQTCRDFWMNYFMISSERPAPEKRLVHRYGNGDLALRACVYVEDVAERVSRCEPVWYRLID